MKSKNIIAISILIASNSAFSQMSEFFRTIDKVNNGVSQLNQGIDKLNKTNKSNSVDWNQSNGGSNSAINQNTKAEDKILKTVVATGYGKDVGEAAQNAAANALTEVVGSLIDLNKELKKEAQIKNGIRNEVKTIKTDIKEYSQGYIEKFEILETINSTPVKVIAKVMVRSEKLKIYVDELSKSSTNVDEGLFATVKTEAKNNESAARFLIDKVLQPSIRGEAIDFVVSKPVIASKLDLSQIYEDGDSLLLARNTISQFENLNRSANAVGFIIQTKLKPSYYNSAKDVLGEISTYKTNSYNELKTLRVNWDKDVVVGFDLIGNEFSASGGYYLVPNVKKELCNSINCLANLNEFRIRNKLNYKSLQVEIKDGSGEVLFSDSVEPSVSGSSRSNKLQVVEYKLRRNVHFPNEWAHVKIGGTGYPGDTIFIRNLNKFIALIALDDDQLKQAKSIEFRLR